ncbi:hypothetical protein pb186bvf_019213 [Paramecium bursaria]
MKQIFYQQKLLLIVYIYNYINMTSQSKIFNNHISQLINQLIKYIKLELFLFFIIIRFIKGQLFNIKLFYIQYKIK